MRIPSWLMRGRQAPRTVAGLALGTEGADWVVMTGSPSAPDGLCCAERLPVPPWLLDGAEIVDAQGLGVWLRAYVQDRDHQVDGVFLSVDTAWVSEYLIQNGPTAPSAVEKAVTGKADGLRLAIAVLVSEGYVELVPNKGQGAGMHARSVRPFTVVGDVFGVDDGGSTSPRPKYVPADGDVLHEAGEVRPGGGVYGPPGRTSDAPLGTDSEEGKTGEVRPAQSGPRDDLIGPPPSRPVGRPRRLAPPPSRWDDEEDLTL